MNEITEKLRQLATSSTTIVRGIDELENVVRNLELKKAAVENEIKQLQATRLADAQALQIKKNEFAKYEDVTRTELNTAKNKADVMLKDVESKLEMAESKLNTLNAQLEDVAKSKSAVEELRIQYEAKLRKLKEFTASN